MASPESRAQPNFAALVLRGLAASPDRAAIEHRGQAVSHRRLVERTAALAGMLRASGFRAGDIGAVLIKDPVDATAAFFALLSAGGVATLVNELYRPRQVEYVLRHSTARVLLTTQESLREQPRAIETDARVICIDAAEHGTSALEILDVAADAPAQVTYTSASTGMPKGVLTSHSALWAGVRIVASYLGLTRDDRIASLLPFSFVYGFNQLTSALYSGATLVVERSTLAPEIVASLRREGITVVAGVPPLWQQLLGVSNFRDEPLQSLRVMTCAGGRLSPTNVRALRQAQPRARLFLMYGLTEVFRSTYLPPDEVDAHPDSMGRAIPESTVYVVAPDGRIAADGEVGELVHGGPTVGLGYHRDPDATDRVFRPNPFIRANDDAPTRVVFSGDLVRRDREGLLYFVGRRDRMIKTLGFRVSPDEVSDVIQASGEVSDVAVISDADPVRGEQIVACVVLRDGGSSERLKAFCRRELPRHMQPARYAELHAIPRNASGKHDIPALQREVTPGNRAAP